MKYYIWLLPSPECSIELRQIIFDLARGFSQPIFHPHLTLWSGLCQPEQAIEWMIGATNKLPLTVSLSPPTFGNTDRQCVFIPVQGNQELAILTEQTQRTLGESERRPPHLSLLYGESSIARRRDVSSTLQLPFSVLTLTEFALVQASDLVTEWKIIQRIKASRGNT